MDHLVDESPGVVFKHSPGIFDGAWSASPQ